MLPPDMAAALWQDPEAWAAGGRRDRGSLPGEAQCCLGPRSAFQNLPGPSFRTSTFSSPADVEHSPRPPCLLAMFLARPGRAPLPGAGREQAGQAGPGGRAPQLPARTCRRSQLQLVAPGRSQIEAPFKPVTLCVLFPKGSSSFMCMQNG